MKLGLLLLIGLPGSGKTTLSKFLKGYRKVDNRNVFFIHICYDDLIAVSTQDFEQNEWKKSRILIAKKIENFVMSIQNKNYKLCPSEFIEEIQSIKSIDCDIVLILDDNMYYRSMRYSFYRIARNYQISFCQVYISCSVENALLKNSLRKPDSVIPPDVIKNMANKIEPPRSENGWEKYSVTVDAFTDLSDVVCTVFPILNDSLLNCNYNVIDEEQQKMSVLENKISILHQVDIALRNIISCKIKEAISKNSNTYSKEYPSQLNKRKNEILSEVKEGVICLPVSISEDIRNGTLDSSTLINFLLQFF